MYGNLDMEWKLIFVGSPGNAELDQELDDSLVGPISCGISTFEFEASPPDHTKIPEEDIIGVAALVFKGSYNDQEFIRIGYYQNTEYDNEEMRENPPAQPVVTRLIREVSNKPRITRFNIQW
jgi:histone chaperone ASF1